MGDELFRGKLNLGVESSDSGDPGSSFRRDLFKALGLGGGVLGAVDAAGVIQNRSKPSQCSPRISSHVISEGGSSDVEEGIPLLLLQGASRSSGNLMSLGALSGC